MYYEIIPATASLRGQNILTYASDEKLSPMQIVEVPLKNKNVPAVVIKKVAKPNFETKPISQTSEYFLTETQINWLKHLSKYYGGNLNNFLSLKIPRDINKSRRIKLEKIDSQLRLTPLNKEQKNAVEKINKTNKPALLHGVTGSGKTRVYIELAKKINSKFGAIILVPEIGLTKQLLNEFAAVLENVFVIHSNLTSAQKHLIWQKIYNCPNPVVIGPRSALFAPIKKLGLIVIDESHESSFKQDSSPNYHAIHAAALLANVNKAKLVLGSATPRIEDYYLAKNNKLQLVELTENATGREYEKEIKIIDLKSKKQFAYSNIFSKDLVESVNLNLKDNKQSLIFHARRGTSTTVLCSSCGWLANCPNCELPLTHHQDWKNLICHICNHKSSIVTNCPECKSTEIDYKGIGTKQIVNEAEKLFPNANIARFDSDNAKSQKLESRFEELKSGKVDIIIGTQGLVKGLDLPHLATVAIINADTLMNIPDYNASENAFQIIHQLGGRVSRHFNGTLFIQTYSPDNPIIDFAKNLDYKKFYEWELEQREGALYPPYVYMMKIIIERKTFKGSFSAAQNVAKNINQPGVVVLGPAPPLRYRLRNKYLNHIILKSRSRKSLVEIAKDLPANTKFDLDPIQLL